MQLNVEPLSKPLWVIHPPRSKFSDDSPRDQKVEGQFLCLSLSLSRVGFDTSDHHESVVDPIAMAKEMSDLMKLR